MRINVRTRPSLALNAEGTRVPKLDSEQELRRTVMTTMLWEDSFYEKGEGVVERIKALVPMCRPDFVAACAHQARTDMKLRHAPLLLVREMARYSDHKKLVARLLPDVIQRADELTEFLAIYWKTNDGKKTLPHCVKDGLATAFLKFSEYQFARNRAEGQDVELRDSLFLSHSNPCEKGHARYTRFERKRKEPRSLNAREQLYLKIVDRQLTMPDSWERELSEGKDKRETFTRLLWEKRIDGLGLIRNLRGMLQAGVDDALIRSAIVGMSTERVLPFRFITAARHAPRFEPELEVAMLKCLDGVPKLKGRTALVIDTSPSMWQAKISEKSEMTRFDAAAALAILAREICESPRVYWFNASAGEIAARRGFALRDALTATRGNASVGGLAVKRANTDDYDRIIVLTDGQWHYLPNRELEPYQAYANLNWRDGRAQDVSPKPLVRQAYMINVANQRNGVGYGPWHSIDGWSEAIIDYVRMAESEKLLD